MKQHIPHGYDRVTSILNPFNDFSSIDPDVLKNAADRGTRVHNLCEAYALKLFLPDIPDDCKGYFDSFREWFDYSVEQVIHTEIRMNSMNYKLSGCMDLCVIMKGSTTPTLIDIKTPVNASPSWALQTAAYVMLADDCLDLNIKRRCALMLPKTGGSAKIIEYCSYTSDKSLFLNALELYRYFKLNLMN